MSPIPCFLNMSTITLQISSLFMSKSHSFSFKIDNLERKMWCLCEKDLKTVCRALIGLKTKDKQELSASTVEFLLCSTLQSFLRQVLLLSLLFIHLFCQFTFQVFLLSVRFFFINIFETLSNIEKLRVFVSLSFTIFVTFVKY